MIFIAGATFTMGAANPKDDPIEADYIEYDRMDSTVDERPAHRAEVKAFCIDRTEVTTAAYTACVQRQRCLAPTPPSETAACNYGVVGRENHPINCVSWVEAQKFCLSQGWGLPSEREWEYAARGTDHRWYPWGNKDPHTDRNRYCGLNVHATTCPVASHPESVSPFGVEDMIGNVREWTTNTVCKYPKDDCVKPDEDRVYRGAAFKSSSLKDRVTSRFHAPDDFRSDELGFRCATAPKP
jgi:formylglycine-generating enzyme required for sulfatase activity